MSWRCAAVASLLITTAAVSGAFAQLPRVEPFGIDGFRLMLQQEGLVTTQTQIGSALGAPRKTVVVVLGDLRDPLQMRNQLEQFVVSGGALVVASDIGRRPRSVRWMGSTFKYDSRTSNRVELYRGYQDCPVIRDFNAEAFPQLFDQIDSLVTNRPAQLSKTTGVTWAARYPRTQQPLMAVLEVPRSAGRMLLIADHSLFINEMLLHGDNARFASNVAKWLTKDGGRSNLVVIHDNRVLSEWTLDGGTPDIPLQDLLRAANRLGLNNLPLGANWKPMLNQSLGDFERQGLHNVMARRFVNGMFGRRPFRLICILLTAIITAVAARRIFFTRARRRSLTKKNARASVETSLAAAYREQQYQPYLRSLCQEFFAEWGISGFSEGDPCPKVAAEAGLHRDAVKDVKVFWDVATKSSQKKLVKRQFHESVKKLRELHRLQKDGVLRLDRSAKPVTAVE